MDPNVLANLSPGQLAMIWEFPAMQPPPGVMPDFENRGGEKHVGEFVLIFGGVLATLSVLLRLWSRFILKKVWIEDALFISALGVYGGVLYTLYDTFVRIGFRVHQWNMQLKEMPHFLYSFHIGSLFYGIVIVLLKVAILLNWTRIFAPAGQRNLMFWTSHILIWANILFYGVGTLTEIFQCHPREKIWNPLYAGGSCPIDIEKHMLASGILNLISDIAILVLPQRAIWSLNVSRRRKIEISALFAIGIFACVSAGIRIIYLVRLTKSEDALYIVSVLAMWTVAEITAGFLIMGLPSLPKVAKSIPGSTSVISFLRTITSRSKSTGREDSNSRRGLPSWYKPKSQPRQRRDPFYVTGDDSQHDMAEDGMETKDGDGQGHSLTATVSADPEK